MLRKLAIAAFLTSVAAPVPLFGGSQSAFAASVQTLKAPSYKCEKKWPDLPGECRCEGIIDCDNMKSDGVCSKGITCSATECWCDWYPKKDTKVFKLLKPGKKPNQLAPTD